MKHRLVARISSRIMRDKYKFMGSFLLKRLKNDFKVYRCFNSMYHMFFKTSSLIMSFLIFDSRIMQINWIEFIRIAFYNRI